MKKTSRCAFIALSLAATALCLPTNAVASLVFNPGFEDLDSTDGPGDGWGSFGAAGFHNFFGADSHASLFMDNPGNFGGVFQTGIAADTNLEYTFSLLNVRIEENAAANARFGLEYYAGDDSTKLGEDITPISLVTTGDGLSFSMSATPTAGTVFVRPIILFDNVTSTANGQENLFVFEVSLTAIPEPTTGALALLFAGPAAVMLRRRR